MPELSHDVTTVFLEILVMWRTVRPDIGTAALLVSIITVILDNTTPCGASTRIRTCEALIKPSQYIIMQHVIRVRNLEMHLLLFRCYRCPYPMVGPRHKFQRRKKRQEQLFTQRMLAKVQPVQLKSPTPIVESTTMGEFEQKQSKAIIDILTTL